ncbi:aldehyde dehydrogenase family protein [Fulvivirgaceae bacterium BMA10]|uniref:Aldehyde dehydrogenase family protein n=1 Tax=Splendidivirga corallicola TaxID=3051826 RepID=A0ABT8KV80_9BACT|nr:aldehyde dehydrogenase family protein [Fulvivirgaceae bacterium BMA10]
MSEVRTITPIDGSLYYSREQHGLKDVEKALALAHLAFEEWSNLDLKERITYVSAFVEAIEKDKDEIAKEITWQMGRPISQSPGEINGFTERARYMISIAADALSSYKPEEKSGFERWIEHVPLGIVAVLSPWNYPYLTSVNAIVPSLVAGNAVILKHSFQTPLVAERYLKAAKTAGIPEGVFQILHIDHENTAFLIANQSIDGVFFTGSVEGGKAIQKSLSNKFIPCGLELGGKDPAYVRADADLDFTINNLVDGAFFNSGQSCCGIERIYVHEELYDLFVEGFAELTKKYRLGNPLDSTTTIGPMVKASATDYVRKQIEDANRMGAKSLIEESQFKASKRGTAYLAPQVLVDVDHNMEVMTEESFGPVVGIMKVSDDAEAIRLMNDSKYGLTASIWTEDEDMARKLGRSVQTGTLFMNRCDYLDPALAWTGVKNTGRGITLSGLGYQQVTHAKSYHLKTKK